jgi:hypothetical protein
MWCGSLGLVDPLAGSYDEHSLREPVPLRRA